MCVCVCGQVAEFVSIKRISSFCWITRKSGRKEIKDRAVHRADIRLISTRGISSRISWSDFPSQFLRPRLATRDRVYSRFFLSATFLITPAGYSSTIVWRVLSYVHTKRAFSCNTIIVGGTLVLTQCQERFTRFENRKLNYHYCVYIVLRM